MRPKRQDELVKYVIDMYIISKEISTEPLRLTIQEMNSWMGLDLCVLCLRNMQIEERDDLVFYNSNCRGDYSTGQKSEFSSSQFKYVRRWRNQTFPMSVDGAVKIIESFSDEDYAEYIELQLSKLSPEITELLFCVSIYDDHISLKDVPSLNISLWRKNYEKEQMRGTYSESEIVGNNELWKEYNGCLYSYDINLNGANSNAAVLGIIKRDNDRFIFEPCYKLYNNLEELANDYL